MQVALTERALSTSAMDTQKKITATLQYNFREAKCTSLLAVSFYSPQFTSLPEYHKFTCKRAQHTQQHLKFKIMLSIQNIIIYSYIICN